MGIGKKISSFFKRKKYDRITREEVVESIVSLQREEQQLEEKVLGAADEIARLLERGKAEKDQNVRLFLAKKINYLKTEQKQNTQRATYILYNIQLLNRLKDAIDEKQFFENSLGQPLNALLADQEELARFLNKTLNTRVSAENVLTSADETFTEVLSAYEENEKIYGVGQSDDELLAMFETHDALESEGLAEAKPAEPQARAKTEEKDGG